MTEIERIACIAWAHGQRPGETNWKEQVPLVCAIIQAMREPTEGLMQVLWSEYPPPMYDQGGDPAAVWKAGIDYLLGEAP